MVSGVMVGVGEASGMSPEPNGSPGVSTGYFSSLLSGMSKVGASVSSVGASDGVGSGVTTSVDGDGTTTVTVSSGDGVTVGSGNGVGVGIGEGLGDGVGSGDSEGSGVGVVSISISALTSTRIKNCCFSSSQN